jgi:Dolichyl-phosphate-mannose-protein mannosyltransferase
MKRSLYWNSRMSTLAERTRAWLAAKLAPPQAGMQTRRRLMLAGAVIFLMATGVRWLYWQDRQLELSLYDTLRQNMARQYRREALRMLTGGGILFPNEAVDRGDALLLLHPPGYAMLMAVSFKAFGESDVPLRWVQLFSDALACSMILLIAAELLPFAVGVIAGLLAALSPQFSYYALQLSPDSLAVLPILLAVYVLIRAGRRPSLVMYITAGGMLGVSCWLRANALLLAPFLALVVLALSREKRWRHAMVFLAAVVLTMLPLIIRNRVLFDQRSLLPVPGGLNLVQGIAEMDKEGRFGMPRTDVDALQKDIEWHNRPDYAKNLWSPDGIERDHYRAERGFEIIRAHPIWFAGSMLRRAGFMLHYNDASPRDWPFSTATVPPLAARPAFSHSLTSAPDAPPLWSWSAADFMAQASRVAPSVVTSLAADGATFKLTGDDSSYGEQLAVSGISVTKNTDYMLRLAAQPERGGLAAKVTDDTGRVVLASTVIGASAGSGRRRDAGATDEASEPGGLNVTKIAFASGPYEQVRVVLSNNGGQADAALGALQLFQLGPTPHTWTTALRPPLRGLQKNLYTTARLLPLVGLGLGLLALGRGWRLLLVLLTVPFYYLTTHSPFSVEYRYILGMHFFLFVLAAVTLFAGGWAVAEGARRGRSFIVQKLKASHVTNLIH